jgi:holliday junction DNA helicase RuvA
MGRQSVIASVRGQVTSVGPNEAVVDIGGGSGGLGFSVQCGPNTLATLHVGDQAVLHTSLIVREDSLTLYGFATAGERSLFELLQTASGVGPRVAQAMLSVLDPTAIRTAIATADTTTLIRVPGIGKKSAERLVLELKDRIGPLPTSSAAALTTAAAHPVAWRDQVSEGLVGLGWSVREATAAIAAVAETLPAGDPEPPVPVLLKQAIRHLGRVR